MRSSLLGLALLCAGAVCASAAEVTLFDTSFAEGVWAFSQGDAPVAIVHFRKALGARPGDGFAHYLLGLSLLRTGEAEEAAQEIAAGLESNPPPPVDRSRILVDLGAARLAAGHPDIAAVALEQALAERKDDAVALHHYATALTALGREEEAARIRERARAIDPSLDPEELPIAIPEVSAREAGKRTPRWSGSVALSAERDSNPNLLSEDLSLSIFPGSGPTVSGRSTDIAALAEVQARHRPIRLPGGWSLGLDLAAGGSFHRELDYLDLARTGGSVQLSRGLGRAWTLLLRTGAEEVFLDGSDYLRTVNGGASLVFSPTGSDTTRLDLRYHDRSFADHPLADPRRDGGETGIALRQIRYFGGSDRYVTLGLTTSDREASPEFRRGLVGGSIDAALPLSPELALYFSGWLDQEDFDDRASNLLDPQGPSRDDRTWGVSTVLTASISDRLQVRLRGAHSRRSSNVDLGNGLDLSYRRTVVGAGLSWSF